MNFIFDHIRKNRRVIKREEKKKKRDRFPTRKSARILDVLHVRTTRGLNDDAAGKTG